MFYPSSLRSYFAERLWYLTLPRGSMPSGACEYITCPLIAKVSTTCPPSVMSKKARKWIAKWRMLAPRQLRGLAGLAPEVLSCEHWLFSLWYRHQLLAPSSHRFLYPMVQNIVLATMQIPKLKHQETQSIAPPSTRMCALIRKAFASCDDSSDARSW